jgi:tetratricopeptide (TPR) repeat protein
MLPSPRVNTSPTLFELVLKIGIVFGIAWFLVSNMIAMRQPQGEPPELKAAENALKANNIAAATVQFDTYLKGRMGNPVAYNAVIELCGIGHCPELVNAYMQRALRECKYPTKTDSADLYRNVAGAYLECGPTSGPQALQAAQQADQLEPDSTESMNSLAYTLAETSKDPVKLAQAEQLVLHALTKLNSQTGISNSALLSLQYRDTYGWVLYKQGLYGPKDQAAAKFDRAVDVLADVVYSAPDELDGVILFNFYYHLGAAFSKDGRTDDARNALLVALHYDPTDEAAQQELAALPPVTVDTSTAKPSSKVLPASPSGKALTVAPPAGPPAFTPLAPANGAQSQK